MKVSDVNAIEIPKTRSIVYYCHIGELLQKENFQKGLERIGSLRQEKIDRCRQPMDKCRALGAGLLLEHVLCSVLGGCQIGTGFYENTSKTEGGGRPYLPLHPNISYSLSHSGMYAACGIAIREREGAYKSEDLYSTDFGIGVDIQQWKRCSLALAKRFFHPEEYARLLHFSEENELTRQMYRQWTAKESLLKYAGTGLAKGMDYFSIYDEAYADGFQWMEDIKEYTIAAYCPKSGRNVSFEKILLKKII